MKKNIFLIWFIVLAGNNFCFSQEKEDLSKLPIVVLKLSDGTEKMTRYPLITIKQYNEMKILPRDSFFRKHPDLKGTNILSFSLVPSVKKILSIANIFKLFKIDDKYMNYDIYGTGNPKPLADKKNIYAPENSIESVTVDEQKKRVMIKLFFADKR